MLTQLPFAELLMFCQNRKAKFWGAITTVVVLIIVGGLPAVPPEPLRMNTEADPPSFYLKFLVTDARDVHVLHRRLASVGSDQNTRAFQYSAAQGLVELLLSDATVPTENQQLFNVRHDLSLVAGRTAWALEELVGNELPGVTDRTTEDELREIYELATAYLEAYRTGLTDLAEEHGIGTKNWSEFSDRYAGQLFTAAIFREFLREWFPLDKPITHLEQVLGRKLIVEDGFATVKYDAGDSGTVFYFGVNGGVIESVFADPLE